MSDPNVVDLERLRRLRIDAEARDGDELAARVANGLGELAAIGDRLTELAVEGLTDIAVLVEVDAIGRQVNELATALYQTIYDDTEEPQP